MGLFSKKAREKAVNFNSVVDYLKDLNRSDYDKILKVVRIYRNADAEVKKVLPLETMPPVTKTGRGMSDKNIDEIFSLDTPKQPRPKGKKS